MKARVIVYPREEILDPQGKAICEALGRVGFHEVEEVRAGKSFDIELAVDSRREAEKRLNSMCESLLANTVIEDYEVQVFDGEAP